MPHKYIGIKKENGSKIDTVYGWLKPKCDWGWVLNELMGWIGFVIIFGPHNDGLTKPEVHNLFFKFRN